MSCLRLHAFAIQLSDPAFTFSCAPSEDSEMMAILFLHPSLLLFLFMLHIEIQLDCASTEDLSASSFFSFFFSRVLFHHIHKSHNSNSDQHSKAHPHPSPLVVSFLFLYVLFLFWIWMTNFLSQTQQYLSQR